MNQKHNIINNKNGIETVLITITPEQNFSPLKFGLLLVAIIFFMFTLHGVLTLEWIGEWNFFSGSASFWILITDLSSVVGLLIRFVGSVVGVVAIVLYFFKGLSTKTSFKLLKIILIAEALYWFTFITSGIWGITPLLGDQTSQIAGFWFSLQWVISMGIPCLFEAIVLPIALFKVVFGLSPTKPQTNAIKWGLIAGTCYILVWWLNNAGMWIYTLISEGTEYLIAYPANLISFVFTVFGLLALGIFSAYVAKKSFGTEKLELLKLRTVGVIVTVVGFYFLWNYVTGIIYGPELWSEWYAWFLGHNLDLWALSLPLLGLPLLFKK